MQEETKAVLQASDITSHLKAVPISSIEIQQDYDYFIAQRASESATLRWTYFLGGVQQIVAAKPRYILSDVRRDYAQNHLIYVAFRVMYIH